MARSFVRLSVFLAFLVLGSQGMRVSPSDQQSLDMSKTDAVAPDVLPGDLVQEESTQEIESLDEDEDDEEEASGPPEDVYQASYYPDAESENLPCFSHSLSESHEPKGVMAELKDVCIVRDDGILYVAFSKSDEEDEEYAARVLKLGEDWISYHVKYNVTHEFFSFSEYKGDQEQQSTQFIETMFLMSVFKLSESGEALAYPLSAKWLEDEDMIYAYGSEIDINCQECFTPSKGRLRDMEICGIFEEGLGLHLSVNEIEIKVIEVTDEHAEGVRIEYSTLDDAVTVTSTPNNKEHAYIISTEIIYIAEEGQVTGTETSLDLTASLTYQDSGLTEFDCINLYNDESHDFVLFSEINALCIYCKPEDDRTSCGIDMYTRTKDTNEYTSFPDFDETLSLEYDPSIETLTISYGDDLQLGFFADEIFYFTHTLKESNLQTIFVELDEDHMLHQYDLSEYTVAERSWLNTRLGGYDFAVTCDTGKCFLGIEQELEFKGARSYSGNFQTLRTYQFPFDAADPTQYCISFETVSGEFINHCLVKEQIQMYVETLTRFPITDSEFWGEEDTESVEE